MSKPPPDFEAMALAWQVRVMGFVNPAHVRLLAEEFRRLFELGASARAQNDESPDRSARSKSGLGTS